MLVMYKLGRFLSTKKENSFHVSLIHNKTKSTESQGPKINIFILSPTFEYTEL